ncbi:hypothetical protein Zmor_013309 [Zophobas morio]|uniref:CRAL-TRIO domain-containing protein n=1 Tax=Zophobas morio TaxID=2755281 RepID=A0AA38ICW8_9CUCU|nr:hypothetical protein Zmor_013305 [Zophobas morio]KAJ3654096.1 hypothetical protein Zmor_013309 [Zophobas morio]
MPKDTELFSIQGNALSSILKVYDKTEESLAEDVLNLKDWMKGQHHLPEILDDKRVQNFLILNKCNVEKAKKKYRQLLQFPKSENIFSSTEGYVQLYIINTVPYVSTLLAVFKTLVKPKLFARVHVCNDANILKEHFPLEMLPRDYGGTEKSVDELHELCELKLQEYQDRFDLLDKLRVNESLRPAILENENDEFLGYHGNFRKLNID